MIVLFYFVILQWKDFKGFYLTDNFQIKISMVYGFIGKLKKTEEKVKVALKGGGNKCQIHYFLCFYDRSKVYTHNAF